MTGHDRGRDDQPKKRGRVPVRKKVERRKRRGEHLKGREHETKSTTPEGLPAIGVKDAHLTECSFDDEQDQLISSYLQASFSSQPDMSFAASSESASDMSATDQDETYEQEERISTGDNFVTGLGDDCEPTSVSPSVNESVATTLFDSLQSADKKFCPPKPLLLETVEKLRSILPPFWVAYGDRKGIYLYRLSLRTPKRAIQREVVLFYDGEEQINIHCEPLPFAADFLKSVKAPKVLLNENSVLEFCNRGLSIAKTLEQYAVCVGADLLEMKDAWSHVGNSYIDNNPYQEERYTVTCRSNSCARLITLGKGKRCAKCTKILRSLKQRRHVLSMKTQQPSMSNIHLNYKQALENLKIKHDELKKKDLKIAYLEKRSTAMIDSEGVDIDEKLSEDLANILANANLNLKQEVFFKEQFACSVNTDRRSHRWHPFMIRFALKLHLASHSEQEALKNCVVVKLPSSRTLYDYSHSIVPEGGILDGILKEAKAEVDKCTKSHQKFVSLTVDEMTVSKNLVYRRSDGQLVGFTHLDEVDEESVNFEAEISGRSQTSKVTLASKLVAFMMQGCTVDVKFLVAAYPCNEVSDDVLYMYARTWNVISLLEKAGIKVLALVVQGCAVSRAFIQMHSPLTITESGIIFDTVNFCSEESRPLYFISDVPYLLKTIRNCFYNSGVGGKKPRCLEINGEKIVWRTIVRLYLTLKQSTLHKSYKLNSLNVFPNSFSSMKVKYAAEVLSETVALYLEKQNWPSTKETIKFIRSCNTFFDILNGEHMTYSIHIRNKNLAPFTDINDSRFEWLEGFLIYLSDWEQQVKSQNLPPKLVEKKLLSRQVREGIEVAIRGFTGATRYLLKDGADCVYARTFSQDYSEQYCPLKTVGKGGSSSSNKRKKRENVTKSDDRVGVSGEPLPKNPKKPDTLNINST